MNKKYLIVGAALAGALLLLVMRKAKASSSRVQGTAVKAPPMIGGSPLQTYMPFPDFAGVGGGFSFVTVTPKDGELIGDLSIGGTEYGTMPDGSPAIAY